MIKRVLAYALSLGVLLVLWWLASIIVPYFFTSPLAQKVLPPPSDVFRVVALEAPELWVHALASSRRVLWAMVIALLLATPLGLLIGFEPRLNELASPLIYLTYPVPKVVFLPILFVLLGLGDLSKIALIALVLFFQILLSARDAALSIEVGKILSVRSAGANRWQLYRHVVFPASLPAILSATRVTIGLAFTTLYLAETILIRPRWGIGKYILEVYGLNNYTYMMAGILVMGLMGLVFYIVLDLLEHWWCRWRFRT